MTNAWYIRNQAKEWVKGPFPGGQISQEILLGRYGIDDEVSHDKEEWLAIRNVPELLPDIFTEDQDDPGFNDRLAAARRWADERRGVADIDESNERRAGKSYENEEIKRLHRLATEAKKKASPLVIFTQLSVVFSVIVVIVILAFQYSPKNKNEIDCTLPPAQGINLSGCNLSGAQLLKAKLVAANLMNTNLQTANLYSADLSHANLKYAQLHLTNLEYVNFAKADLTGASLMGADLSYASLSHANLSYANLRDAKVETTDFSNARLDHAIWIDGRTCRANSIGSCN